MKYKINKGRHYARPSGAYALLSLAWWLLVARFSFTRDLYRWRVTFDASAAYDLPGEDRLDVNKLVGVGYAWGGHHVDSARFGWRYVRDQHAVELFAYCYVSGQRIVRSLGLVPIGTPFDLTLDITPTSYIFSSPTAYKSVPYSHRKQLHYLTRPYFGGNRTAPRDVTIQIKNI